MKGIIYKYTNKINNKVYIGQTISEYKRKNAHKNMHHSWRSYFHNAIEKYGYGNFEYSVLFSIEIDNQKEMKKILDDKEQFYIQQYKSFDKNFGYNLTLGGGGTIGLKCSEEHKQKMSKIMKEKHIKLNENQINALKNCIRPKTHSGKIIEKYTLTGKFLETYTTIKMAAESVQGNAKALSRAIKRDGIFKGYYFKLKENSINIPLPKKFKNNSKQIKQCTLSGECVKIWECYADIARHFKVSPGAITSGLKHNPNKYKGFKWI